MRMADPNEHPIALTFCVEPEVTKQFPSIEAQRAFILYELKCCSKHYREWASAFGKEERRIARLTLGKARLRAYARWKETTAPSIATGPRELA
jgi:hypothetical protein